jgi:hypothetical protein
MRFYNPVNSHKAICVNPKNLCYLRAKKPPKQFEILHEESCPVKEKQEYQHGVRAVPHQQANCNRFRNGTNFTQ